MLWKWHVWLISKVRIEKVVQLCLAYSLETLTLKTSYHVVRRFKLQREASWRCLGWDLSINHECEQICRWFQPPTNESPSAFDPSSPVCRLCKAETKHTCCALPKFLTHRTHKPNKWLLYTTKFWDTLLYNSR